MPPTDRITGRGRSSVMISTSVAVSQASGSKCTLGSTVRTSAVAGAGRPSTESCSASNWPSAISSRVARRRSFSGGISSSVRLDRRTRMCPGPCPCVFENASALRMSMPKLESPPASDANKAGRSRATMVARWTPPAASSCTATPVSRLNSYSCKCVCECRQGYACEDSATGSP